MIMDPSETGFPGGLSLDIPPHLLRPFREASENLRADYAASPDVPTLVRMWLACATPDQLRAEFDDAMLDLGKKGPTGEKKGALP